MAEHEDLPWPEDPTVPPGFAEPSPRYKRLVVASAAVFVAFLLVWGGLTGWLAYLVYRAVAGLVDGTGTGSDVVMALPAGFLCLVLGRGLLHVHRGSDPEGRVRISDADEPVLMAFIRQVADRVGAPHPRHVYLESRVNAAVVQDVHLASLILPRGRDLVIGLGLVNVLSLDEFKAVIAHEFGHFSQKAMGMGRWVYTAQVFVRELVYARGALDRFLEVISRIDIRVAWIGWLMRLVVWSVRALFEQAWRQVTRLQLALTREMEHHADLVAASVSGCDSPVHALHKAMAGDQAYAAAVALAESRFRRANTRIEDLFALQTAQLELQRDISGDTDWGRRPEGGGSAGFRVFPQPLAQRPAMWSTHPANHDREAVIKAQYVPSRFDDRSAWCLFRDPTARRLELTRHALPGVSNNLDSEPLEASLATLDAIRKRPRFHRRYRGLYLKRGLTRMRREPGDLIGTIGAGERDAVLARVEALYPAAVEERLERFEVLSQERGQLQSVHEGWARPPGGVVVFRGEHLKNKEIGPRLEALDQEWRGSLEAIFADFREARAAHLAAARLVGRGWRDHLEGLLAVLHHCEHTRARLEEAVEVFEHELRIALADGKVTAAELRRLSSVGGDLQREVHTVWEHRHALSPGSGVLARFGQPSWVGIFGDEPPLLPPSEADFAHGWHQSALGSAGAIMSALHDLASATIDELLSAEEQVAEALRTEATIDRAPAPPSTPRDAPRKSFDDDALHLRKMPLWERFINADGPLPATARFAAAAAVLAPALFLTGTVGTSELVVFNGFSDTLIVQIDDLEAVVEGGGTVRTTLEAGPHHLLAVTRDDRVVEELDVELVHRGAQALWNVGGVGMMVDWAAAYGASQPRPDRLVVPPSWSVPEVDHLFEPPPETLRTGSTSGSQRTVLDAAPIVPFVVDSPLMPAAARDTVVEAHVRFERLDAMWTGAWFEALPVDRFEALVEERGGLDVSRLVRLTWPASGPHTACADLDIAAALAASPGRAYLAARCVDTAEVARQAAERWPDDPLVAVLAADHEVASGDASAACDRLLAHRNALQWAEAPLARNAFTACRLGNDTTPVRFLRVLHDDLPFKSVVRALHEAPAPGSSPVDVAVHALHHSDGEAVEAAVAELGPGVAGAALGHAHAVTRWVEEADRRLLTALARGYGPVSVDAPTAGLELVQVGVLLGTAGDVDAFVTEASAADLRLGLHLLALQALLAEDRATFDTHLQGLRFGDQAMLAMAAAAALGPRTPTDLRRLASLGLHPALAPALKAPSAR